MSSFGSLSKLAVKYPSELIAVKGLGKAKSAKIVAAIELGRRAYSGYGGISRKISNPEEAAEFLIPELGLLEQEVVKVVILNVKNVVLKTTIVSIGGLNSTSLPPRDIFRPALRENGAAVILAHNHPSGDIQPSKADLQFTERVKIAGRTLGIKLLDHLIISQGRYISLKRLGYI